MPFSHQSFKKPTKYESRYNYTHFIDEKAKVLHMSINQLELTCQNLD